MKKIFKLFAYCLLISLIVTEVSPVIAAKKTKTVTVTSTEKREKAPTIKTGKSYTVKVDPDIKETYVKFTLKKETELKVTISTSATGSLYTSIDSTDVIIWGYSSYCNGYNGKKDAKCTIDATGKAKLPKGTYYLCFQSTKSSACFDDGKKPAPKKAKVKIELSK